MYDEYGNLIEDDSVETPIEQPIAMPPKLRQRYADSTAAADKNVESAQSTKDGLGYANMAGDILTNFTNSQKSDIVLKNRMADLGRKPNIIEADRQKWDRSILDNMGKEKVAQAEKARAKVDSSFQNEMKMDDYSRKSEAAARSMDPASEESASAREYLKQLVPTAANYPGIEKMSAAQIEKVAPSLYKKYADDQKINAAKYASNQSAGLRQEAKNEVKDAKSEKDEMERSVGDLGLARTKQEAVKLRENTATTKNIMNSVDKIIAIKDEGPIVPFSQRARDIETEQQFLMGQLRLPLQGPGAMTDSDRQQLKDTIGNASGLFTINANTKARLNAIKNKVNRDLETAYETNIVGYKRRDPEKKVADGPKDPNEGRVVTMKSGKKFVVGADGELVPTETMMGGL